MAKQRTERIRRIFANRQYGKTRIVKIRKT